MTVEAPLLDLAERVPLTQPFTDMEAVRAYDLGMRRSALMAYKRPTERVLAAHRDGMTDFVDIGFNTGLLSLHISGRLPEVAVSGVEEHNNLVDVAEDNLTLCVWSNMAGDVEFEHSKLSRLPFADDSADIVYSFSSLHRWRRPVETLKEAARICKPGGTVLIEDVNRLAEEGHITFILQFVKEGGEQFMRSLKAAYSPEQAQELLREAGLDDWHVVEEDLGLVISNRPVTPVSM
ncbi:methyltransferase domain-containing protein [Streptomyces sp. NPDC006475]|uniref:Methyltransferase domain-containing protein n=1 Tax=Streptomyces achmelvichensis TaxID=3134111 RepID=A0ACC6Q084_9ACTN|nr:methyltransferase domain-containing protein [Streptomyces sp. NBC_01167]